VSYRASKLHPPKQARSTRTLERIVAASLEILEAEGPAGLTVQRVVDRAASSVGSFYARFDGKEDLLDYLGDRVWREALARWNEALRSRSWSELELSEIVEGAARLLIDAQRKRSTYLEALDRAVGGPTEGYARFRGELLAGLEEIFLERVGEMTHPDPPLAIRVALRAVLGVVDRDSAAHEEPLDRETLVEECRIMTLAYLAGEAGEPSGSEDVEFFDVWG